MADYAPHFLQVDQGAVALVIAEGEYPVDGGMAAEEGGNRLVEYEVYPRLWKIVTQRVEQGGGEDGVAHLAESYDEDVHGN